MTRTTNARIAGATFYVYIAAGVTDLALGAAAGAEGSAGRLVHVVLSLLGNFSALVLAVTLYAITRDQDGDIAMLAMACRVGEGVVGAMSGSITVPATVFAVGSTLFSYLLLRGRMIPIGLARLGVVASLLLVVGLPLQLAGLIGGLVARLMWLPMLVFELALGPWLIVKGVATPAGAMAARSLGEATGAPSKRTP